MFFVTGATGNIGQEVVRTLLAAGHGVRALSRRSAPQEIPAGAEAVQADVQRDPQAVADALDGVKGVFLNSDATGPATSEFLALARDRGVAHVALISSVYVRDEVPSEAQRDEIARMHRRAEEAVEDSGLVWTHVRAEEFALNDLLSFPAQLKFGEVVRGPFAEAGTPTVHEWDLAAVAAHVLIGGPRSFGGQALAVTGPETLTERQRVAQLGEFLGRAVRHEEITPEEGRSHLLAAGVPEAVINAVHTELAERVRTPARPSDVVPRLLGRPAFSYRQWLQDHSTDLQAALA